MWWDSERGKSRQKKEWKVEERTGAQLTNEGESSWLNEFFGGIGAGIMLASTKEKLEGGNDFVRKRNDHLIFSLSSIIFFFGANGTPQLFDFSSALHFVHLGRLIFSYLS